MGCQREVSVDPEKEGVGNKWGCQREENGVRKNGFFFYNFFYPVCLFLTYNPFKCF